MSTVLITGGAGFVGSNAADYFLKNGWNVFIVDSFYREGVADNIRVLLEKHKNGKLEIFKADVVYDFANNGKMKKLVSKSDLILHLAAQTAVTTSLADPFFDFEVNCKGTLNILEAVRTSGGNPVFIYTSTNKVYGELETAALGELKSRYCYAFPSDAFGIDESQPLDFYSPYGCSKGAADQYVTDYARIFGLRTVVFRCSCMYGPRQFGNSDQGWVSHFAKAALLKTPVVIYGDGKQVRDILYVTDVVRAFESAFKNIDKTKGEVYNIGGGLSNTVSILELMDMLREFTGNKIEYSFGDWRPGDQKVYISDTKKAEIDFGWMPSVPVRTGLSFLLEWLKEN